MSRPMYNTVTMYARLAVIFCTFKRSYSSVLCPILVKYHVQIWLIESFSRTFWLWWCAEEKLHFTPVHTLRQLKHDEALFPPLGRVVEFRVMYRQIPVRGFWGVGKIWRPCDLSSRSYKRLYTHARTHARTHAHKAINIY